MSDPADPNDPVIAVYLPVTAWHVVMNALQGGPYGPLRNIVPVLEEQLIQALMKSAPAPVAAEKPSDPGLCESPLPRLN